MGIGGPASASTEKTAEALPEDAEVLASGPVHEAFAEPVTMDPAPGLVAPKAPPDLIEELPPDQKPDGAVEWIPGYWAWDDERSDYIWVSGVWRVPPPDRQWVPGYWNPVPGGYQWISGYWAGTDEQETTYLPPPPESVEIGPSSNAPSTDYVWITGCWLWQSGRYVWRPGYWAAVHPDWVWIPAHYRWTPRGYIFISGYWDYTVIHRGVLFAPIFFPARIHHWAAFSFSPGFIISLSVFDDALFLRPRYCHYYFGDFYAHHYYQRGIYPWFSLHARRVAYDPIYVYQRWHHRHDPHWESRLERQFRERRERPDLRPPRRYDPRGSVNNARGSAKPAGRNVVMPLDRTGKRSAGAFRFQPLGENERRAFMNKEKEMRAYQTARQRRESEVRNDPRQQNIRNFHPDREAVGRSPITDRPNPNKGRLSRSPISDQSNPNKGRLSRSPISDQSNPNQGRLSRPPISDRSNPNNEGLSRSPISDQSNPTVRDRATPPARYREPKANPNVEPLDRRYRQNQPGPDSRRMPDGDKNTVVRAPRQRPTGNQYDSRQRETREMPDRHRMDRSGVSGRF
jgi:hypothetical protein